MAGQPLPGAQWSIEQLHVLRAQERHRVVHRVDALHRLGVPILDRDRATFSWALVAADRSGA